LQVIPPFSGAAKAALQNSPHFTFADQASKHQSILLYKFRCARMQA
jgi:hypothetical protein